VGCTQFKEEHKGPTSIKLIFFFEFELDCHKLRLEYVSVLVEGWTWIPSNLKILYFLFCFVGIWIINAFVDLAVCGECLPISLNGMLNGNN
jgi:hypothetical protein